MDTPVLPPKAENIGSGETERKRDQSFVATVDAGDLSLTSQEDSVVALGTGATANLVRFSLLARH